MRRRLTDLFAFDRSVECFALPPDEDRWMSQTTVSIEGSRWHINGELTYPGTRLEGLLMNSRMVQATFDDLNPDTRSRWDGPDGAWDAEANVDRFIAQLPTYRAHGLRAVAVNFQGGSPEGYSQSQPWHNSAYEADGTLRADYAGRMARVIDACDALGMVVMLGLFYFGQDERLTDEAAVVRAVDQVTDWLVDRGDGNVLIEIGNEVDLDRRFQKPHYEHPILRVERGDELIARVQERSAGGSGHARGPAAGEHQPERGRDVGPGDRGRGGLCAAARQRRGGSRGHRPAGRGQPGRRGLSRPARGV